MGKPCKNGALIGLEWKNWAIYRWFHDDFPLIWLVCLGKLEPDTRQPYNGQIHGFRWRCSLQWYWGCISHMKWRPQNLELVTDYELPYAPWCWNMVYIYPHFFVIFGAHVGEYSSSMEHMGLVDRDSCIGLWESNSNSRWVTLLGGWVSDPFEEYESGWLQALWKNGSKMFQSPTN